MSRVVQRSLLIAAVFFGSLATATALALPSGAAGPSRAAGASVTAVASSASSSHSTKHLSSLSPALQEGQVLFQESCSSCHGINAQGSPLAPSLLGRGAATVDLWVQSGWMPLAVPTNQPVRKPDTFTRQQTIDIANYVASLAPGGPAIPQPNLKGTNLTTGQSLFAENCAACHTITGAGDALSGGYVAPSLHGLTATEISEAILTAPGQMPHFFPGTLTKAQMLDVIAYVTKDIEHASNPGGLALGGVGPVAEGFVGLFIGVGAALLFAMWIGDRSEGDEQGNEALEEAHV